MPGRPVVPNARDRTVVRTTSAAGGYVLFEVANPRLKAPFRPLMLSERPRAAVYAAFPQLDFAAPSSTSTPSPGSFSSGAVSGVSIAGPPFEGLREAGRHTCVRSQDPWPRRRGLQPSCATEVAPAHARRFAQQRVSHCDGGRFIEDRLPITKTHSHYHDD